MTAASAVATVEVGVRVEVEVRVVARAVARVADKAAATVEERVVAWAVARAAVRRRRQWRQRGQRREDAAHAEPKRPPVSTRAKTARARRGGEAGTFERDCSPRRYQPQPTVEVIAPATRDSGPSGVLPPTAPADASRGRALALGLNMGRKRPAAASGRKPVHGRYGRPFAPLPRRWSTTHALARSSEACRPGDVHRRGRIVSLGYRAHVQRSWAWGIRGHTV